MSEHDQPDNIGDEQLQSDPGADESRLDQTTDGDTDGESEAPADSGSGGQDDQPEERVVPLRVLLEERSKADQRIALLQQRESELSKWREENEPILRNVNDRLPAIRQAMQELEMTRVEKARLEATVNAMRQAAARAKETGTFDFDEGSLAREYEARQLLQQIAQRQENLESSLSQRFQQSETQRLLDMERAAAERKQLERSAAFTADLDKMLAEAGDPDLLIQRDKFIAQHRLQPEATAKDVAGWAVDLAKRAKGTRASMKATTARTMPKTQAGSGATEPPPKRPNFNDGTWTVSKIVEWHRKNGG